jgi:hypothetical protein
MVAVVTLSPSVGTLISTDILFPILLKKAPVWGNGFATQGFSSA